MALKIGPHAGTNPTGLGVWLSARPTVAVYQGAFPADSVPGCLIVGRPDHTDYLTPVGDPVATAERWWSERVWPVAFANPHIKTWICSNEPDWKDKEWTPEVKRAAMQWYGRFDYRLAQLAHERGLTLVLGNPAVGCWEVEYLQYWEGGLRACREFGAYYGAHYYGPLDRWHAFKFVEDLKAFSLCGYPDIRIIGTEGGAERVAGGKPWREQYGSVERYVLEWVHPVEVEARKYPQFVGLALFTLGTADPQWALYDVAGQEFPAAMVTLSRIMGDIPAVPLWYEVRNSEGLRLRKGPNLTSAILEVMPKGTRVRVLDRPAGVWWQVQRGAVVGWCSSAYLKPSTAEPTPVVPETATQAMARVAPEYGLDPAVGLAVLRVEAGGVAWGKDGWMIIRLEAHVLSWYLTRDLFARHFAYGIGGLAHWQGDGHRFRLGLADPWLPYHGVQASEWQALQVARSLSDESALKAISMGAGQVMGFNHRAAGYPTARAMFNELSVSAAAQVRAMLDYCKGRSLIGALQRGDFLAFARGYNGSAQAERYARLIEQAARLNGWRPS
jgi:hypothetical protein